MYGSRMTLELLDGDMVDQAQPTGGQDAGAQLDARILELQKERRKFFDQRREFNKLVTAEARAENIEAALTAAAEKLSQTEPFDLSGFHTYESDKSNEAVLVLSDWHYGMKTSNVFNEYSTEICRERVERVVAGAIDRLRLHKCEKLHVVVLGDLIHGAIHVGARVAAEELVADQLMQVSELLAQAIDALSDYVNEVIVYTTYGNHARTVQNKNDSLHRDNMERIVRWWLEQRMKNKQNVVIAPEEKHEFLFVNACGHEICASHGDLDGVKTSPRLLQALFSKKFGKDIECILIGDKHHRESFDECGITALLCGSLCGTDDYANDKRLYSTPQQLMLIVNAEEGIDAEYRLKC